MRIAGVILAGGASRRMGGREKTFLSVGGMPILAHVAQALAAQCHPITISTGGDPARFDAFGLGVIADTQGRGPLAGLASALDWFVKPQSGVTHVLSVPSDTPFLPGDLAMRLAAALKPHTFAACAASGGRLHPVIGLWPLASRHALREAIAGDVLSFHGALAGKDVARVEWSTLPRDPFFNINTPADLLAAEEIIRAGVA
jgi:molybdopterin-guanine dinucleotide biosynthesis protein A